MVAHFLGVVVETVLINGIIIWALFVQAFAHGELVDPVTPVVAAVLDGVVESCSIIGEKVASWVDRWLSAPSA